MDATEWAISPFPLAHIQALTFHHLLRAHRPTRRLHFMFRQTYLFPSKKEKKMTNVPLDCGDASMDAAKTEESSFCVQGSIASWIQQNE
jgi:hypothetical protein